ncbi:hypothetical protein [Nonomuraea sp. NPDC003804]|uniref:hypothetical protein n=1 Tax=Nonomuraea sp. NPDC003804 TaxID=3154547 RepID=UPI0033A7C898
MGKDHAEHLDRLKRAREGKRVDPIATYIAAPRPSPVMVWTPEQTKAFLAYARRDRLFALYRLIAVRGLRRGEGVGIRWPDVIFETSRIGIHWQITQLGWAPIQGSPKTDASDREIAVDTETMAVLKTHRKRQSGSGWPQERLDRVRIRLHRLDGPAAASPARHRSLHLDLLSGRFAADPAVESARGVVLVLPPARFPGPLAEPAVPISR